MKIKNAFALATPPTNANGLDVFAFNANKKLVDCLDWLEYSFPLSYRRKELRGEALNSYYSPMCYLKSREWFRLEPDDTVKAFSFFYANSTRTSLTSSAYTQTLNFVVFANTERIFAEDNIYTETLINQALSVFRDSYFFDTIPLTNTLTVFEDFDDAWQDFDFPEVNKQRFLKENYSTFRIQFDVIYNILDCLVCFEPVEPIEPIEPPVEREQFTESIVFNGQKYQITTQNKDLNISPAPTGHAQGESTLIQYIDGNSVNSINISGVSVVNGQLDNTKRNIIFWLYNNDVSGGVPDKTIVNVVTAPLVNPVVSGAVVNNDAPNILRVTFNKTVTIQNLNGLSLSFSQGQSKNIIGFSGSGTNELLFTLSAEILPEDVFEFIYNQSNSITDVSGNVLISSLFPVQNNVIGNLPIPLFRYTFENEDYTDSSGNGNDATEEGTQYEFINESLIGSKSLNTRNADQFSKLNTTISTDGDFTKICICKIDPGTLGVIYSTSNGNKNQKTLYINGGNLIANGNAQNDSISTQVSEGDWVFIAQTFEESTGDTKLYVNGVLENQGTIGTTQIAGNVIIGNSIQSTNLAFKGLFDFLEYHNNVLTDQEILNIYNTYV